MTTLTIPSAGIDVGYFNTKYSFGRAADGSIQSGSFPSVGPVTEQTEFANQQGYEGTFIEVDGLHYFVGPDAPLLTETSTIRTIDPLYVKTSVYQSLLLGALHYIAQAHLGSDRKATQLTINQLVLGLPLNTFEQQHQFLSELARGEHHVPHPGAPAGHTLTVRVVNTKVVPQPQGTIWATLGIGAVDMNQTVLVLDMGGGTTDWIILNRGKPMPSLSGGHPIGTLRCAQTILDQIQPGMRHSSVLMEQVDEALRTGSSTLRMGGRNIDMQAYLPRMDRLLSDLLLLVHEKVQGAGPLDCVVLAGGGAPLLSRVLPRLRPDWAGVLHLPADPIYNNVHGFYILGEQLNRKRAHVPA